jgi:hypothetical protein
VADIGLLPLPAAARCLTKELRFRLLSSKELGR